MNFIDIVYRISWLQTVGIPCTSESGGLRGLIENLVYTIRDLK
ncbi:hypothetical protein [Okeania sp. SIO1I7]|nr:hypothetical protein [Okeania sp. SIO1I7]